MHSCSVSPLLPFSPLPSMFASLFLFSPLIFLSSLFRSPLSPLLFPSPLSSLSLTSGTAFPPSTPPYNL